MATTNKRVGIAAIMSHEFFQVLTEKQRTFVVRYISSGTATGLYDSVRAVRDAYGDVKNAAVLSSQLLGQKKIKRVLDLHFGRTESPYDSMMAELTKALKKSIRTDRKTGSLSTATMRAMDFFEEHEKKKTAALKPAEPEDGVQKYAVGDVVLQDGKQYRIVAQEVA
jgi:phage terminase small subunit